MIRGLQNAIKLGELIEAELMARQAKLDPECLEARFIEEDLLFPLRVRILAKKQQLLIIRKSILPILRRQILDRQEW